MAADDKQVATNSRCPKCNAEFVCGASAGAESCWCMGLPLLANVDKEALSCYCSKCLKEMLSATGAA